MRYVIVILGLLGVIALLGFTKASQIKMLIDFGKQAEAMGPPPESVATAKAVEQTWESTIPSVGTVAAAKGVTISNDAPGLITRILFDSGQTVKQGEVLLVLDSSVEQAQIASVKVRRELATKNAERSRALAGSQSISKAQLDNDETSLKSTDADLDALQAQIGRKVVRAPFSGHLGIRNVNLGQYLNPGTAITTLEAMDSVYVDFTLPQQRLKDVMVGTAVRVELEDGTAIQGAIAAVDPAIDPSTRSLKLRAGIDNKEAKLRPGMFVRAQVILPQKANVVAIPATALLHASYGDSVYVAEQGVARQQFVRTGPRRGDFVAISEGIKAGEEVVTQGGFKLRNGAKITVNNDVGKKPELEPHPENQ